MPDQLEALLEKTDIVPAVNQVELHPYFQQQGVQDADAKSGIVTQVWSPIGGITVYPGPWGGEHESVLNDEVIKEIASEHNKTPAQVMIRWHLQEGRSAIPKSIHEGRIKKNFDVFDFELSDEEITKIDSLETGIRGSPDPTKPQPQFNEWKTPEA